MPDVVYTPTGSQSPETQHKIEQILKGFQQKRLRRYNFEMQWQESSLLAWPEHANTFFYGYDQYPGASIASHYFGAIMDSLLTPQGLMWSRLKHPDKDVMKQRGVQAYYDKLSSTLWQARYAHTANFVGSNQQNLQGLGVFGNMNMYTDALDRKLFPGYKGLRYCSLPVGQMYYVVNAQGAVDSYYRAFRWTARQIYQCWPNTFPESLKSPLESESSTLYWVIQYVCRRDDYMPWEYGPRNKRWASYYISEVGKIMLEESGYRTFPVAIGRYMVAPDEDYGRGPAQMVLATMKTKNAEKVTFLKQGHRAGDPTILGPEEGLFNPEFHPGGYVSGGMNSKGQPRVGILPVGNINITKEMMDAEQIIIDEAFLVNLYKMALDIEKNPQLGARQVVELLEQRAVFLAPTAGRQITEYLGTMLPRELDILSEQGMIDAPPPVVLEAGGIAYDAEFDNPMTRMMAAGEVAGYMQAVEMVKEVVQSTGDPSHWDHFAFKRSLPDIALRRGFPSSWMATAEEFKQAQKQRAQDAERDRQTKELPGRAAIMKAQAIQAKAETGGNIGGTLSGTPPGGMPEVPGNAPGLQGQPGSNGQPGMPGIPAPPGG